MSYKIYYNKENQWISYDNVIYSDEKQCDKVIVDAKEQFPHIMFQKQIIEK